MPDFAALDAVHQGVPTNFDSLDSRMVLQSDATQIAHSADSKLYVKFYARSIKDEAKSLEQGRAIHEDKVFINIKLPGDKNNDVNRVAYPEDIQRFPMHYERFRKGQEQVIGTPITALPFLSESQVADYTNVFVRTVEQLAGMPDNICQRMLGSIEHKQKAQLWLDSFKGAERLRAEFEEANKKRDEEFAAMREQITALQAAKATPLTSVPPVKK